MKVPTIKDNMNFLMPAYEVEEAEFQRDGSGERKRRMTLGTRQFFMNKTFINFDLKNLDTSRYRKNPGVFFNHNVHGPDSFAVGKTTKLNLTARGDLKAEFDWAKSLNETGETVREQYNEGILKAASIGVQFNLSKLEYDEKKGKYFSRETSLTEWSLVNIPADQNALTYAMDFNLNSMLGTLVLPPSVQNEHPDDEVELDFMSGAEYTIDDDDAELDAVVEILGSLVK